MEQPLISLIHPTARFEPTQLFPFAWLEACWDFYYKCAYPEGVEYVVVAHESHWERLATSLRVAMDPFDTMSKRRRGRGDDDSYRNLPPWGSITTVRNTDRCCLVDQTNAGGAGANPSSKLLVCTQDDLGAPQSWDTALLRAVPNLNQPWALHAAAGQTDPDLAIAVIETRARYEELGYLYHPAYTHLYVDDDWTGQARADGVLVDATHIKFVHAQHAVNTPQWDVLYRQASLTGEAGRQLFELRKARGFPW